ncbi:uncharacterized protein PG986_006489 [Apiospora aurea]|uniref:Uncharacterized protein n=1 Tax=Apiospora aurea TaxID=335848 RepID=A0ABR1QLD3_9PEZI
MPANANANNPPDHDLGSQVTTTRFTHLVVAVCEDVHGTAIATKNTLELGCSVQFHVECLPPTALVFRLRLNLTAETILYLQFTPAVISSLARSNCDSKNVATHPSCYDVVRAHLGGRKSFTRLQFSLRGHGDVITPAGFALDEYDADARRTFASIASLATAPACSLYMPREALPNKTWRVFYQAYQQSTALTDLRNLYNGNGGTLFRIQGHDQDEKEEEEDDDRSSSISLPPSLPAEATVGTIAAATAPPSYDDVPPQYNQDDNKIRRSSPLPSSQESTASETDAATVAVATPPGYRRVEQESRPQMTPRDVKELGSKRCWSSDGENTPQYNRRPMKRRGPRELSEHGFGSKPPDLVAQATDHDHYRRRIEALETGMEQLRAEMGLLRRQNGDLEEGHAGLESRQEAMAETLETMGADVDELAQEMSNTVQEQLPEMRQELDDWQSTVQDYMEGWVRNNIGQHMERYMADYVDDTARGFLADLKGRIRSSLDDNDND